MAAIHATTPEASSYINEAKCFEPHWRAEPGKTAGKTRLQIELSPFVTAALTANKLEASQLEAEV